MNLAPWDYNHRLLLAGIKEAQADRVSAEAELREAIKLAPNYPVVHWRLANVLVRQGKLGESLSEFLSCELVEHRASPIVSRLSLESVSRQPRCGPGNHAGRCEVEDIPHSVFDSAV